MPRNILELPTSLVVQILKLAGNLRDVHSFGCGCRESRGLLEGNESREI